MAVLDAGPLRGLRHPPFRALWGTFVVTQIGFWMSNVALQWQVARLTDSDTFSLGLLYFANLIPLLLVTPFAGVAADQLNRRVIVVLGHTLTGTLALLAGVAMILWQVEFAPLLLFAFGIGSTLAFGAPAGQALVANCVPMADMGSAVSLQSAGLNLARIAGPAVATPMLVAWGAPPAFLAYAVTSFFTAAVIARISVPRHDRGLPASVLSRLRGGIGHARERRPAVTALFMVAVAALFGSSYVAMLPVFAYEVLGREDGGFTALLIATGAGAMVGALASGSRAGPYSIRQLAALMLAMATGLAAFAASSVFVLSLVLAAVAGALNFAVMTGLNTVLQHAVDDQLRGRVMSLYVLCWGGLIPIGALGLGALAALVGAPVAVALFAAAAGSVALVLLVRGSPS